MTSSDRSRQLAKAKAERQHDRRLHDTLSKRRRRRLIGTGLALTVLTLGMVVFAGTRSSTPVATDSKPTTAPVEPTQSPIPSAQAQPPVIDGCTASGALRAPDLLFPNGPPDTPLAGDFLWELATICGEISIAVNATMAPQTARAITFLTAEGYFNDTACHRLTTKNIYVLQCGDATGVGTGGPGFTIPEENLPANAPVNYPAGTVAMANAGPGTTGSQFFIVYEDTTLPANYTIIGTVTAGLDRVRAVAAAGIRGEGTDGPPRQTLWIKQATVGN